MQSSLPPPPRRGADTGQRRCATSERGRTPPRPARVPAHRQGRPRGRQARASVRRAGSATHGHRDAHSVRRHGCWMARSAWRGAEGWDACGPDMVVGGETSPESSAAQVQGESPTIAPKRMRCGRSDPTSAPGDLPSVLIGGQSRGVHHGPRSSAPQPWRPDTGPHPTVSSSQISFPLRRSGRPHRTVPTHQMSVRTPVSRHTVKPAACSCVALS